jgi:2-keto-4-pentenoate hydratase
MQKAKLSKPRVIFHCAAAELQKISRSVMVHTAKLVSRRLEINARDAQEQHIAARLGRGEKLVGIKLGGALLPSDGDEKKYQTIFGYLTDAMQQNIGLHLSEFVWPRAEGEVVFKLAKDVFEAITLADAPSYVEAITVGAEFIDYRSADPDPLIDEAIADNAGAAGFALGDWVSPDLLSSDLVASIHEDGVCVTKAPVSTIFGNPWMAIVRLSELMEASNVTLAKGSILFSSSATDGIVMQAGKNYRIEIEKLGHIEIRAI